MACRLMDVAKNGERNTINALKMQLARLLGSQGRKIHLKKKETLTLFKKQRSASQVGQRRHGGNRPERRGEIKEEAAKPGVSGERRSKPQLPRRNGV